MELASRVVPNIQNDLGPLHPRQRHGGVAGHFNDTAPMGGDHDRGSFLLLLQILSDQTIHGNFLSPCKMVSPYPGELPR